MKYEYRIVLKKNKGVEALAEECLKVWKILFIQVILMAV